MNDELVDELFDRVEVKLEFVAVWLLEVMFVVVEGSACVEVVRLFGVLVEVEFALVVVFVKGGGTTPPAVVTPT